MKGKEIFVFRKIGEMHRKQKNSGNQLRWYYGRERYTLASKDRKIPWLISSILKSVLFVQLFIFILLLQSFRDVESPKTLAESNTQSENNSIDIPTYHPKPSWNLHAKVHKCTISKILKDEFNQRFPYGFPTYYHEPIIVVDPNSNPKFTNMTSKNNVPLLFESDTIKLPKADLFSFASDSVLVEEYINLPETKSFDEASSRLYMLQRIKDFSAYKTPRTTADISDQRLGIGSIGSGAQWHAHGPGFCEVLHGRKHWALVESPVRPFYERRYPSRHWFEYHYHNWTSNPNKVKIWECTVGPGDSVYFPNNWYHTTVNLDAFTVFVTSFFELKPNINNRN